MLGVLHGVRELGPVLHVVARALARALLGPPMRRVVSMAAAVKHAAWGGVGGDGRAAFAVVSVAVAAAVAIAVLGESGQCRDQLRTRQFRDADEDGINKDHGTSEGTGLGLGCSGREVHSKSNYQSSGGSGARNR
jgi:hypothetical protein